MNDRRRTSIVAGTLLVVATVTAVGAAALVAAVEAPDYLTAVAGQRGQVAMGALLYVLAAGTSAGIAIALYPITKRTHPALALGSVVFRTIEATMYMVAVVSLLTLVTLSGSESAAAHAVGDALLGVREHATLAGVVAFSAGALLYYVIFYAARLVPRWLSGWGIVGVIGMLIACLLALFSDEPITGYTAFVLPIAIQELVLAVWLLTQGFNPAALASIPQQTSATTVTTSGPPRGPAADARSDR